MRVVQYTGAISGGLVFWEPLWWRRDICLLSQPLVSSAYATIIEQLMSHFMSWSKDSSRKWSREFSRMVHEIGIVNDPGGKFSVHD